MFGHHLSFTDHIFEQLLLNVQFDHYLVHFVELIPSAMDIGKNLRQLLNKNLFEAKDGVDFADI